MSRYRKIFIKMWGDGKFRNLTMPGPNGQTLTGEHDPVFGFAGLMMKAFKDQEFNQALDIVVKHIMELFPN